MNFVAIVSIAFSAVALFWSCALVRRFHDGRLALLALLLAGLAIAEAFVATSGAGDERVGLGTAAEGVGLVASIMGLFVVALVARLLRLNHALERELREAQRVEALGTLAAGVAHELNNLLMAIFGYKDLAYVRAGDDKALRDALDAIERAASQANDVTKALLTFGRKSSMEKKPQPVGPIVEETAGLLRRMLPASVELRCVCPTDVDLWADIDAVQLQQALVNLVVSARDALPDGGRVDLTLERRLDPREAIALTVADNGIGMTPDVLDRSFDPSSTTRVDAVGHGIGLALVRSVVEAHGGELDIESEPGKGTVVTLLFECVEARPRSAIVRAPAAPQLGRGERVLLAEDSLQTRSIIASSLEAARYEVWPCADGAAALERFRADPGAVDILVLDMDLPRLGCRECLASVRELRPGVPAILMTGLPDPACSEENVDFLRKPFQMADLVQLVHRRLARNGVTR